VVVLEVHIPPFAKCAKDGAPGHRLRDTFAIEFLEKGIPMEEVSKLLGHTSIRTTEKSYAEQRQTRSRRLAHHGDVEKENEGRMVPTEITPLKSAVRVAARKVAAFTKARRPMKFPTYPEHVARRIERYHDDVRFATLALAVQRLHDDDIPGAFAEVGVYQGATSAFLHQHAPTRDIYLFDTFAGFPKQDLVGEDTRFRDTSLESVRDYLGDSERLKFRKGYFPETAEGLDDSFALVMLDVDLYRPALEVLSFFYPRMVRGGYFFMHDFNSPESEHAIARAAREFMADKPELIMEIPDFYGTAMFRKM
jgi:O-methyltransferase